MNFKRIISIIICGCILSSVMISGTAKAALILGDVNGDTKIDSKDAVLILKSYADSLAEKNSDIDKISADVNEDSSVDSKDAVLILRYYAATLTGYTKDITEFIKRPVSANGHYFGEISLVKPKDFYSKIWCTVRKQEGGYTAGCMGIGSNLDEAEIKKRLGDALQIVSTEYGYNVDKGFVCYVYIGD